MDLATANQVVEMLVILCHIVAFVGGAIVGGQR